MKRNWFDKKVLVLGLSKSGVAAARYLNKHGATCYLSDSKEQTEKDSALIAELNSLGINVEMGEHSDSFIEGSYLAITSPGIPPNAEIFKKLSEQKTPVISEIELTYLETAVPFIGITGTNGKTTTTELTSKLLGTEYIAPTCGNIGLPPVSLLDNKNDYFVCELSSYQLHFSRTFKPQIAMWLNFTPDHIQWHEGLENYFEAKASLFAEHKQPAYAIFNACDENVCKFADEYKGEKYYFGKKYGENCCYVEDNAIFFQRGTIKEKIIELVDIALVGEHNYQNVEAGVIAAKIVGISQENIVQAIKDFRAPEHRCEFVSKVNSTEFYNDSKATNPEASIVAIKSFSDQKVVLIAGGRDKNTSLDEFCDTVKQCISKVLLIGEASERFRTELEKSGFSDIENASSMEDAIERAIAGGFDVCLLSPACASFDMYDNFEQRGVAFKEYVLSKV